MAILLCITTIVEILLTVALYHFLGIVVEGLGAYIISPNPNNQDFFEPIPDDLTELSDDSSVLDDLSDIRTELSEFEEIFWREVVVLPQTQIWLASDDIESTSISQQGEHSDSVEGWQSCDSTYPVPHYTGASHQRT